MNHLKIKYLNGPRLRRSVIAAARRISLSREHLNRINVFPVPDGDTGTNMVMTMEVIASGIEQCNHSACDQVSNTMAESAVEGARGNSGVILAEFFQGFADATRGKIRLTTQGFAHAAHIGVERAKEAMLHPREGTILTVMRDWANHLVRNAPQIGDFVDLLRESLSRAKESLADTPKKLEVLHRAGVVDAGAQGFVNLLEGLVEFIETGKMAAIAAGTHMMEKIKHFQTHPAEEAAKFRYCTECLLQGEQIDREALKIALAPLGDSLIVMGNPGKVRIHIHSNSPEEIFEIAAEYGVIRTKKVDDMYKQISERIAHTEPRSGEIALVTDSTCDLPDELIRKYHIHLVPVNLHMGEKSYLDRVEVTTTEFYHVLESSADKLSTSQPSLASFKKVYEDILPRYKSVIALHLAETISGTINGARLVAKDYHNKIKIDIIDSNNTSAALGLLVLEAAKMIEQGLSHQAIVEKLRQLAGTTSIFVSVPTLKYLIRSGRVTKLKGALGTTLNVKPVIQLNSKGEVLEVAKVVGKQNVIQKTLQLAQRYAARLKNPRFAVVHVLAREKAEYFRQQLQTQFAAPDILLTEASPALGVHTGIGSVAIAIIGEN